MDVDEVERVVSVDGVTSSDTTDIDTPKQVGVVTDFKDDADELNIEIKMLHFLIHNRTKIMYAVRHRLEVLYNFDVNKYVDIVEYLKRKKFRKLNEYEDDYDKKIIFAILEIMVSNIMTNKIVT